MVRDRGRSSRSDPDHKDATQSKVEDVGSGKLRVLWLRIRARSPTPLATTSGAGQPSGGNLHSNVVQEGARYRHPSHSWSEVGGT